MTTDGFVLRVEELGYRAEVEKARGRIYIKKGDSTIVRIGTRAMFKVDSFYDTTEEEVTDLKLFELIFEYIKTPIEKRGKIKLTEDEIVYLKFSELRGANYIARDKNGNLYSYYEKPKKDENRWIAGDFGLIFLTEDSHSFRFIKWDEDDSEPYRVDELLVSIEC